MIKLKLFIWLLFTSLISANAQIDSIILPDGDSEIRLNRSTTIISSFYVTKQGQIFLEDEPINLYEIGPKLQYYNYKLPINRPVSLRVFVYADKDVKYQIIDKLKTQLAQANISAVVFKTGTIKDKDILTGNSFFNYYSIFHYPLIFKQYTRKEIERNKRFNDSLMANNALDMFPSPPPTPIKTTYDYYPSFYSDRQVLIDEVLHDKSYKCVSLKEDKININGKAISYNKLKEIDKFLEGIDFLIIKFGENLTFNNYLKTLSYIKDIQMPLFKSKQKGFHIIEISKEMEEIHKKTKINLCD